MPLKFRLRGLAETFIDAIRCPCCGHDGGDEGDQGFKTDHTRVTYDGIIVVLLCEPCGHVFVPDGQKLGVINKGRLRAAVKTDSSNTGQPVFAGMEQVRLEVERLNAERILKVH